MSSGRTILFASSSPVPLRRATIGGVGFPSACLFLRISTTPFAIRSILVSPPKELMKMTRTSGSDRRTSIAARTLASVAPPPPSRKFAGCEISN